MKKGQPAGRSERRANILVFALTVQAAEFSRCVHTQKSLPLNCFCVWVDILLPSRWQRNVNERGLVHTGLEKDR